MQVPVLKISSATNTARIGRRRPMFTSFPPVVHHKYRMFTGPSLVIHRMLTAAIVVGWRGRPNEELPSP
jgi:hypothetical protein